MENIVNNNKASNAANSVSDSLKARYIEWLTNLIDEVCERGVATVMLSDDLIVKVRLDNGELHWERVDLEEIEQEV